MLNYFTLKNNENSYVAKYVTGKKGVAYFATPLKYTNILSKISLKTLNF